MENTITSSVAGQPNGNLKLHQFNNSRLHYHHHPPTDWPTRSVEQHEQLGQLCRPQAGLRRPPRIPRQTISLDQQDCGHSRGHSTTGARETQGRPKHHQQVSRRALVLRTVSEDASPIETPNHQPRRPQRQSATSDRIYMGPPCRSPRMMAEEQLEPAPWTYLAAIESQRQRLARHLTIGNGEATQSSCITSHNARPTSRPKSQESRYQSLYGVEEHLNSMDHGGHRARNATFSFFSPHGQDQANYQLHQEHGHSQQLALSNQLLYSVPPSGVYHHRQTSPFDDHHLASFPASDYCHHRKSHFSQVGSSPASLPPALGGSLPSHLPAPNSMASNSVSLDTSLDGPVSLPIPVGTTSGYQRPVGRALNASSSPHVHQRAPDPALSRLQTRAPHPDHGLRIRQLDRLPLAGSDGELYAARRCPSGLQVRPTRSHPHQEAHRVYEARSTKAIDQLDPRPMDPIGKRATEITSNSLTGEQATSHGKTRDIPKLSLAGAKRRFGFKQKGLSSLSVQRSEEVIPLDTKRSLMSQLAESSFEESNGTRSSLTISSLCNHYAISSIEAIDPRIDFIYGLGEGQIASRQALVSPQLGDIQLALSDRRGMLEVEVVRARGLLHKSAHKTLPSPYVKIYLMRNKKCLAKFKTQPARQTLNPLYQQRFIFREDYTNCILQAIVWGDYGKKDRKSLMGIVQIRINDLDISELQIGWYRLFNAPSMSSSLHSSRALRQMVLAKSLDAASGFC